MNKLLKKLLLAFLGTYDGNPFSILGSMWPADSSGKYVIQAEGIRLAFVGKGGALANFWINDTSCREIDVVLGFDNATQYDSYASTGATLNGAIGRYAGLISGGKFQMNGVEYQTPKNYKDKRSTFHGGDKGWGNMKLHVAAHTKNSITFVVFDGRNRNGFPGTAAASLTHTVTPYEWRIAYGVTPVGAAFPVSLSQQVFWNLDGLDASRSAKRDISDHMLKLPFSGLRLDEDEDGIPTGDIRGNRVNASYDFWSAAHKLARPLDNTFLISRRQPWDMHTAPVATLESAASGVSMDLYTNEEALHVITWEDETGKVALKKTQRDESAVPGEQDEARVPVPRHAAVSLQMHDWTDAINHPEWQREDRIFWGTDRLYTTYSKYKFSVKRESDRCI